MKRSVCLLIVAIVLFTGCTSHNRTDITREEIIDAYETAGYSVSSRTYDEKPEDGQIGYIRADHTNGDYIYFSIFETEEAARAWKDEYYHPTAIGLFSFIFGAPAWVRCEVYGCVLVEYDDPNHFYPFEGLLTAN